MKGVFRRITCAAIGATLHCKRLHASADSLDSLVALIEDNLAYLQASILLRIPSTGRIDKLEAYGMERLPPFCSSV
jgi:hypothetical protein